MQKNKLKYKRVKIIWQDICYLYYKDSKVIKIFSSFSFDGNKLSIGNVTAYPRCVVKKIEYLK